MRKRLVVALVAAAAVAAAAGAYAWATGTGPGAIAACAQKVNGQLRLDTGAGCRPSEDVVALAAAGAGAQQLYAHVDNGVLDTSRSSGVLSMTFTTVVAGTLNTVGVYCFDLAAPASSVVAAGALGPKLPDPAGVSFSAGVAAVGVAGTTGFDALGCPAGTDAVVESGIAFGTGSPPPGSFYASFQQ